ncbi:MAG: hypothetical protein QG608_1051 [Actinomycetota bacterium]|nr:hypothetical protein [Actinomycetota bacterium]
MFEGDGPPGLRPERLLRLMRRSLDETAPDLRGATVLTEAATGAYAVTPVIAALAGADHVYAVTRSTRYGSAAEVMKGTMSLAEAAGVADRITVHAEPDPATRFELLGAADVVTNSGHLRPLDAASVAALRPTAVVPLMFEAWEVDLGREDIDLAALRERGVRFSGTDERHPAVDVFGYLGAMAVRLLEDAQTAVRHSRIALLCDNPFAPYLESGLVAAGATVRAASSPDDLDRCLADGAEPDAVVVALSPTGRPVLGRQELERLADRCPGVLLAQFWGDLDREVCARVGLPCAPAAPPAPGHMGVLPSAVGPEPIVRLQAGGIKVASVLRKDPRTWTEADRQWLDDPQVPECSGGSWPTAASGVPGPAAASGVPEGAGRAGGRWGAGASGGGAA